MESGRHVGQPDADRLGRAGHVGGPIVSHVEHAGRNSDERNLGYKYLLVSEFVARRRAFPGELPYCAAWADHNRKIFLEHQSYIDDPASVEPSLARCAAEAFAPDGA